MSFGYALKKFREERGFSLRELGRLSGIDHAYIHRLERDEKNAPSEEVVDAIARTLKLSSRRANLLRILVGKTISRELIDVFIEDEELPVQIMEPASQISFRGKRPQTREEWQKQVDRLREFLEEE